jgi:hypothetical protein
MSKPIFYKTVLVPIKGNVLDHVYPHFKGGNQLTMTERMGNKEADCPECIEQNIQKDFNRWMLLPEESVAVVEGGKPYCQCLDCGYTTHL